VLATIVINIVAVSLLTFAPWSDWRTGAALNIVDNCLLVGFALVRRDMLLRRFLLLGVVVVGKIHEDAAGPCRDADASDLFVGKTGDLL
jgi:hypothetical protein